MNLSLKKILKQLDVLFVSELDTSYKKIENILHLFFKDIFHTNSLLYAKEIYEKSFPSVLIIDINLKESSGLSFIKDLRKKNKTIPIIIITENKEIDILDLEELSIYVANKKNDLPNIKKYKRLYEKLIIEMDKYKKTPQ